ncbi:MAG: ComEA family DNA-binding protein [Chloroflexota bacterium]
MRSNKAATLAAYVLVAVALIASSVILLLARPTPVEIEILPPQPTFTPLPTATDEPYTIYITGAVNQPQTTITLPAGARVQDAIVAAGGPSGNADLQRVNLADILRDGDQVHVPAFGEVPGSAGAGVVDTNADTANAAGLATPSGGNLVNVNTADSATLETLPRIGPALAGRIIAYREANGPFSTLADLENVSGIGPATVDQLAPLVTFEFP